MTKPKVKRRGSWSTVLKRRSKAILALVGAVIALGTLVAAVLNQSATIIVGSRNLTDQLIAVGMISKPPCVEISEVIVPKTVKLKAWDNMPIEVRGRNNCAEPLGLYVTFVPRKTSDTRFRLQVPYEDVQDCDRSIPLNLPKCWERRKPIVVGKGEWTWAPKAPPLYFLSDPRPTERISISADVRNVDYPEKPPYWADSREIDVTNE